MSYNAIVSKILDNIVSEVNREENMDRIKKNGQFRHSRTTKLAQIAKTNTY